MNWRFGIGGEGIQGQEKSWFETFVAADALDGDVPALNRTVRQWELISIRILVAVLSLYRVTEYAM